jgi:hypothetical protein
VSSSHTSLVPPCLHRLSPSHASLVPSPFPPCARLVPIPVHTPAMSLLQELAPPENPLPLLLSVVGSAASLGGAGVPGRANVSNLLLVSPTLSMHMDCWTGQFLQQGVGGHSISSGVCIVRT